MPLFRGELTPRLDRSFYCASILLADRYRRSVFPMRPDIKHKHATAVDNAAHRQNCLDSFNSFQKVEASGAYFCADIGDAIPSSAAVRVAAAREETPSLAKIAETWCSTVFGER
jgi:hypothetical protein